MAHQPSDEVYRTTDRSDRSRRRYLAGIATAGSILAAGCLGGDDGGGSGDGDDDDDTGAPNGSAAGATTTGDSGASADGTGTGSGSGSGSTGGSTTGPTDGGGADDGCPSPPLSYSSFSMPPSEPEIVFDVPEGEYATVADPDDSIQLRLGSDPVARLNVSIEHWTRQSVQERIETIGNTDVTNEYDAASSATVLVSTQYDRSIPHETNVIFPLEEGTVDLLILHSTGYSWCPDALVPIHQRMVESARLP